VVIVFSTTDLDLLIGKGIKLPVVDVEVPIVGFYAALPYLLVLVHFHLLLQLQLLSRKLYAFDRAASGEAGMNRPYVLSHYANAIKRLSRISRPLEKNSPVHCVNSLATFNY
jgi:hypothetical protein